MLFVFWGYRKHHVSISGALAGFPLGMILVLASDCFFICLAFSFISCSKVSKFRTKEKAKFEKDPVKAEVALLYLIDVGSGERPIDLIHDYRASWLALALVGSLACTTGDTWASELGSVLQTTRPRLITTLRTVPRGTNGAVTLGGLIMSALGGALLGTMYYLLLLFRLSSYTLASAPPQINLVFVGALAGVVGSLIDSFLGATVQLSALDETTGIVVDWIPSSSSHKDISPYKKISGFPLLDNHGVNLLSSITMALWTPELVQLFGIF
ncbi:unnamed protein product [Cyprideis torosa]|uniref:Transmembrane protein 19 n=1 Tax=Cyprideis torosa TaxID=163714 RepID=A0A7R8ZM34_9CRUS|nr:unnamed protein product [Cyprideis torosa]CAG0893267.1 unnamed protein product [Cyprideis torosa]